MDGGATLEQPTGPSPRAKLFAGPAQKQHRGKPVHPLAGALRPLTALVFHTKLDGNVGGAKPQAQHGHWHLASGSAVLCHGSSRSFHAVMSRFHAVLSLSHADSRSVSPAQSVDSIPLQEDDQAEEGQAQFRWHRRQKD